MPFDNYRRSHDRFDELIKLLVGHGLGVVELTVALHYLYDTPHDRLVWDVGHQSYPHKILTGRREAMAGLRQRQGASAAVEEFLSDHALQCGHLRADGGLGDVQLVRRSAQAAASDPRCW